MTEKGFLITHFMETADDKEITNGESVIFYSEWQKDIFVESLKEIYEAEKKDLLQYHIYVEEVIDGVVKKRIQHIGWSRGRNHE